MVHGHWLTHILVRSLIPTGMLVVIRAVAVAQLANQRDIAIYSVAAHGDVDGDAVSDFVACEVDKLEGGQSSVELVVRSGRDGHAIHRLPVAVPPTQIVCAGDLDGDEVADLLVLWMGGEFYTYDVANRPNGYTLSVRDVDSRRARLELVSGKTAERRLILDRVDDEEHFGRSMTLLRSRKDGGLLAAIGAPGPVLSESTAFVSLVDLRSGAEVGRLKGREVKGETSSSDGFGTALASVADPAKGRRRLLVGAPDRSDRLGAVDAFASDTLELVWSAEGTEVGHDLGGTILEVGDVDGDGVGDAVASSVHCRVDLLSGADGKSLWHRKGPWQGTRMDGWGDTLALVTDWNGDGYRDLAVGHFEGLDEQDGDGVAILSIRTGEALAELAKGEQTLVAGPALGPLATDFRLIVAHPFTGVIHQFSAERRSPAFTVSR
jgi:hypothetical protein